MLRLLDLEHAKTAVLNSLTSPDAQRGYRHAIDEFVEWYCSEPRLAFNRVVVLRYRSHLESRQLAPAIQKSSDGMSVSCLSFRAFGPVGVGIAMARDPLRRSGQALLTHPAPTLGDNA